MVSPFEGYDESGDAVLDLVTGEVIYSPVRGGWGDEEVNEALGVGKIDEEDIALAEKLFENPVTRSRYLRIPQGESWWGSQDLQSFVGRVENPKFRDRLARTIHGAGTFGRFKEVIAQTGGDRLDQWYTFEARQHKNRVREWLEGEGIELEVNDKRSVA